MPDEQTPPLPTAVIDQPSRSNAWLVIIPLLAVLVAAFMLKEYWQERGLPITITFEDGHGLKAGDVIKCRGIIIGEVQDLILADHNKQVIVNARIDPSARDVLKDSTDFWIVRPELNISGLKGIDTIVGAKFIRAVPHDGGDPAMQFIGVEDPPITDMVEPGGLEITLQAREVPGLRAGSVILYRQMPVGRVLDMTLDESRQFVNVQAYLQPEYVDLARTRTVFWKESGARVEAGLFSGFTLEMDSVESLVLGGISMSFPPRDPGDVVTNGYVYRLYIEPEEAWLNWLTR
jgi:paraquat-inducible protein B